MSPKQKVLRVYPNARSLRNRKALFYYWRIYPDPSMAFSVGAANTARAAWIDAASMLRGVPVAR